MQHSPVNHIKSNEMAFYRMSAQTLKLFNFHFCTATFTTHINIYFTPPEYELQEDLQQQALLRGRKEYKISMNFFLFVVFVI
jgi:hypothetical protein